MKTCRVLSKITALCLALLMVVSALSTATFAISSTDKGTITVNGVEDGVTVSAYRLMDVNYDFDKNEPVDPVYSWVAIVQTWVDTNYPAYRDANEFNTKKVGADAVAEFYDKLAAAIKSRSVELTPTNHTGSGNITNLNMGNYLILIENGMKVYRPSAVNLVPQWNETSKEWEMTSPATITVKASEPSLDKSINEDIVADRHPTGKGSVSTTGNITGSDNASIGDTINFDLRADIPQYPANAIVKNYAISDKLSDGLTLDSSSIEVYGVAAGGDETLLSEPGDYTITYVRPSNQEASTSFTVNFAYDHIKGYEKVHIHYEAVLNENAVIGSAGNPNKAYLDYSNNPYDATSWNSKADKVTVYTYGIDVTKTNKNTTPTPLPGAEFELSKSSGGDALRFIAISDNEGVYRLAKGNEQGSSTTVLTVGSAYAANDMKGKLLLVGLDAGTYYLKETKAPAGYNKISTPIEITIADSDYDGGVEVGEEELVTGHVPVTVQNSQGFELPTTGGIGTVLFTAVGVALMGAGLVLFFLNRKRRKAE